MNKKAELISMIPAGVPAEITPAEEKIFFQITSSELTDAQKQGILTPAKVLYQQERVLGVHWHPEFIPMDLIRSRIEATFPNRREELIIPTQHNELMTYGSYVGVEVDCYASGFN
jgi:hypothetical protein